MTPKRTDHPPEGEADLVAGLGTDEVARQAVRLDERLVFLQAHL